MVTQAALVSGPIFTTFDADGTSHQRSTFAKSSVCDAPDWVAQIGSAGGEHNIGTCPQCWLQAVLKARREATGVEAQWRQDDAQFLERQGQERPESYQVSGDELERLLAKQSHRFRRVAAHAPPRKLPGVLRELRTMAAVISRQLQTGKLSKTQSDMTLMRYYDVQAAASIAWERLKDACEDRLTLYRMRQLLPPSNPYASV